MKTTPTKIKQRVFQLSNLWLILFVIGGIFISGKFSQVLAPWITPFFGFMYYETSSASPRKKIRTIYFAFWFFLSVSWFGATPIWGLAHFIFMGMNAIFSVLPYALYLVVKPRFSRPFLAALIFPLAGVAVEWLAVHGSPFGSFGSEAYSQFGFLPLIQIASVTGLLGITFLTQWFSSVLFTAVQLRLNRKSWLPGFLVFASCLVLVLGWGFFRISPAPQEKNQVDVLGLTIHRVSMHELGPLLNQDLDEFRIKTRSIHEDYRNETVRILEQKMIMNPENPLPRLVVWPELAGVGTENDVQELLNTAGVLAKTHGIYLGVPSLSLDPLGEHQAVNQIHLFDPSGEPILHHIKFGGNFIEGTFPGPQTLSSVETPIGRISAVICWDADFPSVISQAGREGVDILIIVALDWPGIDPLHGRMAVFRGIENGLTVFRQADTGWSVISDKYGRILASASGPRQVLQAKIPVPPVSGSSANTFYPLAGDWLGIASLAILLVVMFRLILDRIKNPRIKKPREK